MSDKSLRSKIIRLAHAKPELRKDLLPLLTKKAGDDIEEFLVIDMKDQIDNGQVKVSASFMKDLEKLVDGVGDKWDFIGKNRKELFDVINKMSMHPMRKKDIISEIGFNH